MSEENFSLLCCFLNGILGVPDVSEEIKENLKSKKFSTLLHLFTAGKR